ncbi:hypothetical protein Tco_0924501 [Tanacetum coccineum]|uniref:Uncharacterized protein n=1 Tax=Tanacetum coccineum TaxID=301880 RepID=A0ABQ5D6S1_9ASTR
MISMMLRLVFSPRRGVTIVTISTYASGGDLILYQAYGNLYATTALGRHLEEKHVTWALFWKKRDKMANGHTDTINDSRSESGVFDLLGCYCRNPYHSGLVVGIESIEPAEMGELNASAMEVEGLMSQVNTSILADVVRSKASDLSTIDGDISEFAGSLNIQPGLQYAGDESSYTALGLIYITESSKLTGVTGNNSNPTAFSSTPVY